LSNFYFINPIKIYIFDEKQKLLRYKNRLKGSIQKQNVPIYSEKISIFVEGVLL